MRKVIVFFCLSFTSSLVLKAQLLPDKATDSTQKISYSTPKEYEIGKIDVVGSAHLDVNVITLLSGLTPGDKVQVPGDKFSSAIENLWKQGLFQDVKITAGKIRGNVMDINIIVTERPRLSKYLITGIKKSEVDDVRDKIKLTKGKVLTDGMVVTAVQTIKSFFKGKGHLDVMVTTKREKDAKDENAVVLSINVKKGSKIHIKHINFIGVTAFSSFKVHKAFKETKVKYWWNPFTGGKFKEADFEKDEKALIEKYNAKGYRDAKIVRDSIYRVDSQHISIDVVVDEGKIYYFRNINWIGNSKYSGKVLSTVLGIKKGDVYNQEKLETRLFMNPSGSDVTSLYMDDGYLFFSVTPTEIMAANDSIDFEMHIYEGKQATINKITIMGNEKTNDHVILRELRTQPGQLFRRSDVMRSQREIAQLGYFDAEKTKINPIPNPATGTVDIEYTVKEKPSDQIQLSGGYGNNRLIGTLGVTFTNFSARNFFKKESWRPLPSGDGQRLSVQAQSSGTSYQSYNLSFTEPWLGGKKPKSLTVSIHHSQQTNGLFPPNPLSQSLDITGVSIGLGKRLKFPDDYFTLFQTINYDYYTMHNYTSYFSFANGYTNNLYYKVQLQRNSIDRPTFETRGSQITISAQFTPPYSLFNHVNYSNPDITQQDKYRFVEYQKYKFSMKYFMNLTNKYGKEGKDARNLILKTSVGYGFLSSYSLKTGEPPFERFFLGGSGLTGYSIGGREVIALRGYDAGGVSQIYGGAFIAKYTVELRYPISMNPQATIFVLAFADAGNTWNDLKDFNPFAVNRSVGPGIRVFLPMFGLLGLDYGWRLDDSEYKTPMQKSQFSFTIGATLGDF